MFVFGAINVQLSIVRERQRTTMSIMKRTGRMMMTISDCKSANSTYPAKPTMLLTGYGKKI